MSAIEDFTSSKWSFWKQAQRWDRIF